MKREMLGCGLAILAIMASPLAVQQTSGGQDVNAQVAATRVLPQLVLDPWKAKPVQWFGTVQPFANDFNQSKKPVLSAKAEPATHVLTLRDSRTAAVTSQMQWSPPRRRRYDSDGYSSDLLPRAHMVDLQRNFGWDSSFMKWGSSFPQLGNIKGCYIPSICATSTRGRCR